VTVAEESGKAEKAEQADKAQQAEQAGKTGKTGKTGKADQASTSEKAAASDRKSPPDSKVVPRGDGPTRRGSRSDGKHLRVQIARVVGLVFLLLALVLALAALCIALEANPDNSFVTFVLDAADAVDLGVFDLTNPIKEFGGDKGPTKEALLNYGLGAVVYLIVGRILERIIRP
jgi:hypothetical protein